MEEMMIKVLDHGYVKLIESMGTDRTVIEAARMSTSRGFERWEKGYVCKVCRLALTDDRGVGGCLEGGHEEAVHQPIEVPGDFKLLEYLFSNGHTTPFEMCDLHIEVFAPILTWRQWMRHRMQSYNEQSARYGPLPDVFYVPSEERIADSFKASKNKQASGSAETGMKDYIASPTHIENEQRADRNYYESRLATGMAPELAHINVPVSQYSKARCKTDLHNWFGFLRLRDHEHAQYEIRVYAEAVASIIEAVWPRCYSLYEEYTKHAVRFSRSEIEATRKLIAELRSRASDISPGVEFPEWAPSMLDAYGVTDKAKRTALLKKLGLES